jgi:threonyl-tRNA synthetase
LNWVGWSLEDSLKFKGVAVSLTVQVAGSAQTLPAGTSYAAALNNDKKFIAALVNGELRDLVSLAQDGEVIEGVELTSAEGLSILRHSTAHVMAQAVQQIWPQAHLGIGPPISDGFYYDFGNIDPLTPEDLDLVEKKMREIVNAQQKFSRRVVSESQAKSELAKEPFKLELVSIKGAPTDEVMEVGGAELTIYDNLDKDGNLVWCDLCRGPHIPHTGLIKAFKLMKTSAAYWRGSEKNPSVQRIYGTAWVTKEDLNGYLYRLAEAEKRDHRKLGVELDLFSFPEELGSGLPVFHPKGGVIRRAMEDYSRAMHEKAGYEFVYTPHITKSNLFETSGHLQWFADGMYPPMKLDEELNPDGTIRKPGVDYYLKPMNCPFHNLIYKSRGRSYRELPLRLFEFGSVYRYEKSGVIHGLTRVRGMTQDDAHIYCTREQMAGELKSLLDFVLNLLRDYGLDDFYLELSTKNAEKAMGSDADWEQATQALSEAAHASGLKLVPDPGGAAFYGPKISVQVKDAIGRTWQMSTIQVDFQLPQRFELEYQANDGNRQQPIMIHRALFGSVERFLGVLTEHYAGAFPPWLAPIQVIGIPVADTFNSYLDLIGNQLREHGVRVEIDKSDERMQKKIRNAQKEKIPFMLIAGEEDQAKGAVSFRYRDGTQVNAVAIEEAIRIITDSIKDRKQV